MLGQRGTPAPDGSDGEAGPLAAGEATATRGRSQGSADLPGGAVDSGGRLAATGAPDLVTASMAASGLLAVGAGLFLVGRYLPGRNVGQ